VLVVLGVNYQVRCVMLSTGHSVICVWVYLDPQYSVNYSQRSLSHCQSAHSASPSAVSNSTNNSIQVCSPLSYLCITKEQCLLCCLLLCVTKVEIPLLFIPDPTLYTCNHVGVIVIFSVDTSLLLLSGQLSVLLLSEMNWYDILTTIMTQCLWFMLVYIIGMVNTLYPINEDALCWSQLVP